MIVSLSYLRVTRKGHSDEMALGLGLKDERESKIWEVERTAFQTVETVCVKALGQK